jgi:hypothetical protein
MIKNYDEFVNEGFLSNVISGIDAGIGAFKASRNAEKAADDEMKMALNGKSSEYSDETKMTILVKQLVERAAWLADGFSWEKMMEDTNEVEIMEHRIEKIEILLSKMRELLEPQK